MTNYVLCSGCLKFGLMRIVIVSNLTILFVHLHIHPKAAMAITVEDEFSMRIGTIKRIHIIVYRLSLVSGGQLIGLALPLG